MRALLLPLALVGCGVAPDPGASSAGRRLEEAAAAVGLVPTMGALTGVWARGSDRMCVAPGTGGVQRVGIVMDYGPRNGCSATGTLRQNGAAIDLELGGCRLAGEGDRERISLPADPGPECARLCQGNASLSALRVERVSDSVAEAQTLRDKNGRFLCPA